MMKKVFNINRRQFLNLGSKLLISSPLIFSIGCDSKHVSPLNPKDSLKKLILILGPWTAAEKQKSEDFIKRFMKSKQAIEPYIPGSGKLIQQLAYRFPAETMAIDKINLQNLPVKERELLMNLTKQLYSFIEVRFHTANVPPWGHCQGDRLWHTRTPVSSAR